jgi:hypothetical protein
MCDCCYQALLERLAMPDGIRVMIKTTMTTVEILQMRHERENMALQKRIESLVLAAHAIAGYPRHLMIPESAGVM